MNEEMEEFIVECMDVSEIDSEYEFDAARFFDFCRPESTCEAQQAERWFLTAATYLPSPLVIKLNLGKELTTANSHGCSRLQQGKTTKLKSNNSYIPHVASQVSPSNSKIKGTISDIHSAHEICATKPSLKARNSTLMKPTASHLAKQKFQKTSNSSDVTSSQNSLASESIATKTQKLEIGCLLKIAQLKHQRLLSHKISKKDNSTISNSTHPTCKVTVPRERELKTLQRAQRRIFRLNKESEPSETKMFKSWTFNRNIFKKLALPYLRKIGAPLPNYSWLSSSPHSDSAAPNALVDFKRANNQSGVKQRKSATLLSSTSHKCNKIFPSREDNGISGQKSSNIMESKSIFDDKLLFHPPIEMFNKLSLRSEKEARAVAHPQRNPSAKGLMENAPNYLQLKSRKCFGKTKQCVVQRHSNTNRAW